MELVEAAMNVLKIFKDVTTMMSSQRQSTASLIKPLLHRLMQVARPVEEDQQPIHQAKATLFHDLEKRYIKFEDIIIVKLLCNWLYWLDLCSDLCNDNAIGNTVNVWKQTVHTMFVANFSVQHKWLFVLYYIIQIDAN